MLEDHKKRKEDPTKALDELIGQANNAVNQAVEPPPRQYANPFQGKFTPVDSQKPAFVDRPKSALEKNVNEEKGMKEYDDYIKELYRVINKDN